MTTLEKSDEGPTAGKTACRELSTVEDRLDVERRQSEETVTPVDPEE